MISLMFVGQIADKHYEDYLKSLRHKSFVVIIKKCKDARYLRLTVPNVIRSGVTSSTHTIQNHRVKDSIQDWGMGRLTAAQLQLRLRVSLSLRCSDQGCS